MTKKTFHQTLISSIATQIKSKKSNETESLIINIVPLYGNEEICFTNFRYIKIWFKNFIFAVVFEISWMDKDGSMEMVEKIEGFEDLIRSRSDFGMLPWENKDG